MEWWEAEVPMGWCIVCTVGGDEGQVCTVVVICIYCTIANEHK